MVTGLDKFQQAFAEFKDHYVLIGGTAAFLTMDEAGLEFRATKDLDMVLHVEALSKEFGQAVWKFIQDAGYQIQQVSETEKPRFYRFTKPADKSYPAMLELFSRAPDAIEPAPGSNLTPIPLGEALSSLSAILLDEEYYRFIIDGRRTIQGLTLVGEDRLIPLKASAWLDLSARKARGEEIDSKNIRKHCSDVLRLSSLLTPQSRIPVSAKILGELQTFINTVKTDETIHPKDLGIKTASLTELLQRIEQTYTHQSTA